jgi:hypothetical protein
MRRREKYENEDDVELDFEQPRRRRRPWEEDDDEAEDWGLNCEDYDEGTHGYVDADDLGRN